jgi:hypothetical protein
MSPLAILTASKAARVLKLRLSRRRVLRSLLFAGMPLIVAELSPSDKKLP